MGEWGNRGMALVHMFPTFQVLLAWFSCRKCNIVDAGIGKLG